MDAADEAILTRLAPPVAAWLRATFPTLTEGQRRALPHVLSGRSVLLSSPTGTGKTLAGFLGPLSGLHGLAREGRLEERTYALYVSPLKALVHDVARNLRRPLEGIEAFAPAGLRVALRTGDTPQAERARQARAPPHLLATTPESLALLLASPSWWPHLQALRWVVVDEVHALAETKRGTHLALLLEMLEHRLGRPLVRVGLSATVSPLPEVARFLTGGRPCAVEAVAPREDAFDLDVVMPLPDPARARDEALEGATLDLLERVVARHRTTLVFANTRRLAERTSMLLHDRLAADLAPDGTGEDSHDPEFPAPEAVPPVAPHHGSMSRDARLVVEERLRRQELRCVVSSSSLELGLDVEGVDHVVLLGSPKGVARTLQRLGRADHRVGGRSQGTLVVGDPDELAEAFALRDLARRREVEDVRIPHGCPDVLAQFLVGLALLGPWTRGEAHALVRRAAPYADLGRERLDAVLDALLDAPRPLLDAEGGTFRLAHGGARVAYLTHAGTIPESGTLKVVHAGTYVGEVEEAFVESLQPGDVFQLAGSSWRFLSAVGLRAHVAPAAFAPPTVPAWRSEGVSATPPLARHAAHLRAGQKNDFPDSSDTQESMLRFQAFQAAFSALPPADALAVESFVHEDGSRAHVAHAFLGRRANDALARALAHRLGPGTRSLATDAGFALLTPRGLRLTPARWRKLLAPPLEGDLRDALRASEALRRRFRHVATRGLLLLRPEDVPLSRRQQEANALLARMLERDPDHPLLQEAWREALEEAVDLPGAERVAWDVAEGRRAVHVLPERPCASPYAARILHRPTTPDGRESIRDHEERAREWLAENAVEKTPPPGEGVEKKEAGRPAALGGFENGGGNRGTPSGRAP